MGGKGSMTIGAPHTNWKGFPRKRCQVKGCKKRARHEMSNGEMYCKKHSRGDE